MKGYIPFGIRFKEMITIDEIKPFERGSLCDCFCPNCEKPLIAVLESDYLVPHFRHKKGHLHCHFEYDEIILEYILKLLGDVNSNALDQIITYGIEHFVIRNKLNKDEVSKEKVKIVSTPTFFKNSKKEIFFKVIIDGMDFQVRITTRKKIENSNQKEIIVSISDLLKSKEPLTNPRLETLINELSSRVSRQLSNSLDERLKYIENIQKTSRQLEISSNKEIMASETLRVQKIELVKSEDDKFEDEVLNVKDHAEIKNDFMDYKIRNGICPKCKEGKLTPRFSRNGSPFFGCSIYPRCNYIHSEKTAYHDVEKDIWVYHEGR